MFQHGTGAMERASLVHVPLRCPSSRAEWAMRLAAYCHMCYTCATWMKLRLTNGVADKQNQ